MAKKVYIVKDANGDVDKVYVADDLTADKHTEFRRRLEAIGCYLDSYTVRGNASQLAQRITELEKE